ncbi:MAG: PP2C family protein-serine/threonine phosphatase [Treponemataceae bacterium]|nr:PP2C family protein-serine/threonine phosphatase [Treponemataceae bacterium]
MNQVFSLSFWFIAASLFPLWYSANSRKEYGDRPRWLLVSLLIFICTGICVTVGMWVPELFPGGASLCRFLPPLLYALLFSVAEYSIHSQRIQKNLLFPEFASRLVGGALLLGGAIIALVLSLFVSSSELVILLVLLFGGLVLGLFAYNMVLFSFEEGIIRFNKVHFIIYMIIVALGMIFTGVNPPWGGSFFFFLLNLLFGVRIFHEYFWYRMEHFNQVYTQQEEHERNRIRFINEILTASPTEEQIILKKVLERYYDHFQEALANPNVRIKSLMLYTKRGQTLRVESDHFIIGYCTPLINLETLKRLNTEAAHTLIKEQTFTLPPPEQEAEERSSFPEHSIFEMLQSRDIVAVEQLPTHLAAIFKLIIFCPVFNQQELVGMIVLFKEGSSYVFPKERSILNDLANEVSIALTLINGKRIQEDKNRLSQEMDVARNIQMSVLPKSITIEGYDVAASMTTATEVGGDLYDYLKNQNRYFLAIGDVAGHGLPAGLMALTFMSALHGCIKTQQELGQILSPSQIYDIVNRVLVEINRNRIGSDKFMTANIVQEEGGTVTYAGSHLIGLVYRSKEKYVEEIPGMTQRAAFLGLSEYAHSSSSLGSFTLAEGDVLLLYTDGLIEARNKHGELFGLERVKQTIQKVGERSAEEIRQSLLEEVSRFAEQGDLRKYEGNFADDITLVVLKKQ